MARSQNPVDIARRAARKKALQKNKVARLEARDAKVCETKTVAQVQTAIHQLTKARRNKNKHHDNNDDGNLDDTERSLLSSDDQRKLERLEKELRLVTTHQEQQQKQLELEQLEQANKEGGIPAQRQQNQEAQRQREDKRPSVEEAKASVYYDAVMNPYGAPPPGQRRMYHKLGGGVTPYLHQALIQRVPPPSQPQQQAQQYQQQQQINLRPPPSRGGPSGIPPRLANQGPPRGPPPPPPIRRIPPPPPPRAVPPPPPPPPMPPKHVPPPLPPPSQAVQRSKRKLLADIWASQEELVYEGAALEGNGDISEETDIRRRPTKQPRKQKATAAVALEQSKNDPCCPSGDGYSDYRNMSIVTNRHSTHNNNNNNNPNPPLVPNKDDDANHKRSRQHEPEDGNTPITKWVDRWYYVDNSSSAILQGPFASHQMMAWRDVGCFPLTTPVRNGEEGPFQPLSQIMTFDKPPVVIEVAEQQQPTIVEQDSVEDRIAALRQARQGTTLDKNASTKEEPTQDMTAVTGDKPSTSNHDSNIDDRVEPHLTTTTRVASTGESYSSPEETAYPTHQGEIPYPIVEENAYHVENQPDIPYPIVEEDAYNPADSTDIPYPVDEDAYNSDDNADIPYPMEEEEDAYYPVNEEYPVTDTYEEDMPAVAPYPTTHAHDDNDDAYEPYDQDDAPYDTVGAYPIVSNSTTTINSKDKTGAPSLGQKKVFTGDKAIVGFVPSHLQVKRKTKPKPKSKRGGTMPTRTIVVVADDRITQKATPSPTKTTTTTTATAPSNSVADDYDKFMQEISALK